MRFALRLTLLASGILLILLFFVRKPVTDLYDQYNIPAYVSAKWDLTFSSSAPPTNLPANPGNRVVVMAKMAHEDTSWVASELPTWRNAIYTVNPTSSTPNTTLTTPANKGHEAMAYLTYLIDAYDDLPEIIAFLHSHRDGFLKAWHVDDPLHSNPAALKALHLDYVREQGYVNLRCNWNPGCLPAHRHNTHVTDEIWAELWEDTSSEGWKKPAEVGAACCAQFAVSKEQVLKRPKSDYEILRRWLVETKLDDAKSGRVMEFLWHVVFGREGVHCPDEKECYCKVYGRC